MIEKTVRHFWNALSGVFVLSMSILLTFGPGMTETDTPNYMWYNLLFFVLWAFGFVLQFRKTTKVIGLIITLVPTLYYLILFIWAVNL
jgi:hypothetical protein